MMEEKGYWERFWRRRLSRRTLIRGAVMGSAGLAAAYVVGCGEGGVKGRTGVRFAFSFPAPHAGLLSLHYVAQDRGYFADEGLVESVIYQTAVAPLVVGGTVEYAEADPLENMNAFAAGQPLKAVYQPLYGFFFGVRVPADSKITEFSAAQLKGQTVGITEFGAGEVSMLLGLLKRAKLEADKDVKLFPTSGSDQAITIDAFKTNKIQVMAASHLDFAAMEGFGLKLRDITPSYVSGFLADNAVTVRAKYLAENRDEVIGFCRAEAKAKVFAAENPRATAEIGLKFAPETGSLDEVLGFVNLYAIGRLSPPAAAGIRNGEVPVKGWTDFMNFLLESATGKEDDPLTFKEPIDVSKLIDNSLLDKILDFDVEAIKRQAREYKSA